MFDCTVIIELLTTVCLCVSEINRVRKDMYSDSVNGLVDRHPLELPEPIGPIVHLQEKLFVPIKEYPDVSGYFTHLALRQLYQRPNILSCCRPNIYSGLSR